MKQTLKILTLVAIGVAVGRVSKIKRKKYVSKIGKSLIEITPNKVISIIR